MVGVDEAAAPDVTVGRASAVWVASPVLDGLGVTDVQPVRATIAARHDASIATALTDHPAHHLRPFTEKDPTISTMSQPTNPPGPTDSQAGIGRANRLAGETSPYLLQHAHNPVDWYPWGPDALEKARSESKPIFLSIGYAACHWCHVMEKESFEDEATAADLNAGFVAIKVDREERPDLDAVYMEAVQQMTGQGGWPMSVFLTPDGKPFYGGTYFPDQRRHGLPSFRDILAAISDAWRTNRRDVEQSASRMVQAITPTRATGGASASEVPAVATLEAALVGLERTFDAARGGWGGAPKFPQPMVISWLLRHHARTGDKRPLAMARRTLDAMADGGINDQLGGGFARYATDAAWLVPHFEKMLYDNGLLARVYLDAFRLTGEPRYAEVARATLDLVARELRTASGGGFCSSLDADTNGEEGLTYVWTGQQIDDILGPASAPFKAAYGVTDEGNWEGHNILSRVQRGPPAGSGREVYDELGAARRRLLEARQHRPQPRRDDKIIASWNGLALAAFADASWTLSEPRYMDIATTAARSLLNDLRLPDGRLRRSWKDGRTSADGVLEDHTHLAEGLLAVYQATFAEEWFLAAVELMTAVVTRFSDEQGGFHDTASDAEQLLTRPKRLQDDALPAGNAMAATVLLRLAALTGEGHYRDAAEGAIALVAPFVARYPSAFGQWLIGLDLALGPIDEVAIIGRRGEHRADALLTVARQGLRPRQVVAMADDARSSVVPLLAGRTRLDGQPAAYVCHGFVCQRPVTDPAALSELLAPASAG
ncbi:thioredoxin domain-containing protein [soil metagenome]